MPGGGRVRRPGAQGRRGAPMNVVFTRKLRLRPTILTLFVLLTVPVFFTIVAVTYLSNDSLARSHANDLVTRFRADAISNIQDMFDPIKSLVRSAAAIGNEQPDFYASNGLSNTCSASWSIATRSSACMSERPTARSGRRGGSTPM